MIGFLIMVPKLLWMWGGGSTTLINKFVVNSFNVLNILVRPILFILVIIVFILFLF